jgi:hypothetical protein
MPQENVEMVRAGIEAWNAGDIDAVRRVARLGRRPEGHRGWPERGPFVGREAVMRQFEQLRAAWDTDTIEVIGDALDFGDRSCGADRLACRSPGPRVDSGVHDRLHDAQGTDPLRGALQRSAEALGAGAVGVRRSRRVLRLRVT